MTAVFGSLDLGSAIGLLICGPLIKAFGWPSVFYLFALLGLVWCAGWPLLRPEDPDPAVRRGTSPAPAAAAKRTPHTPLLGIGHKTGLHFWSIRSCSRLTLPSMTSCACPGPNVPVTRWPASPVLLM